MDENQTNPGPEQPREAGQPPSGAYGWSEATPPPPPPRPAPQLPPRYQAPPPPARRSSFWRIMTLLLVLCVLFFLGLLTMGIFFMRGGTGVPRGARIGLLRVQGPISQDEQKQFWMDALREMSENSRIKGVVVRIDSPGGTVGASQELYGAIDKLRTRYHKPVFISMGDITASGGYYMASAANKIYALKGTLTGSIGVIFSKPQISDLTKKIGYATEIIKSGRFKDSGSITRPLTDPERAMFDVLIQNTYQQFIGDVLKYRTPIIQRALAKFPDEMWTQYDFTRPATPTARDFLLQIADGRVYTGEQALQLGLVDEIGSLDDTIQAMGHLLQLEGRPETYEPSRKTSLRDLLKTQVGNLLPSSQGAIQYLMELP